jgi:hypothetical protein
MLKRREVAGTVISEVKSQLSGNQVFIGIIQDSVKLKMIL